MTTAELRQFDKSVFPLSRYEPIERLGSRAVLSLDKLLNREVVVKTLGEVDLAHLVAFQHDGTILCGFHHKNVAAFLDFGATTAGVAYMVSERHPGITFDQYLQQHGRLAPEVVVRLFIPLANALTSMGRLGLLHRDLKPANIMLNRDSIESGLCLINSGGGIIKVPPHPKFLKGRSAEIDPSHAAPEFAASQIYERPSEVFTFGCLFFEAITGAPPFSGPAALADLVSRNSPSLSQGLEGYSFPYKLESFVAKCLNKHFESRYQSVHEVEQVLRDLLRSKLAIETEPPPRAPQHRAETQIVVPEIAGENSTSAGYLSTGSQQIQNSSAPVSNSQFRFFVEGQAVEHNPTQTDILPVPFEAEQASQIYQGLELASHAVPPPPLEVASQPEQNSFSNFGPPPESADRLEYYTPQPAIDTGPVPNFPDFAEPKVEPTVPRRSRTTISSTAPPQRNISTPTLISKSTADPKTQSTMQIAKAEAFGRFDRLVLNLHAKYKENPRKTLLSIYLSSSLLITLIVGSCIALKAYLVATAPIFGASGMIYYYEPAGRQPGRIELSLSPGDYNEKVLSLSINDKDKNLPIPASYLASDLEGTPSTPLVTGNDMKFPSTRARPDLRLGEIWRVVYRRDGGKYVLANIIYGDATISQPTDYDQIYSVVRNKLIDLQVEGNNGPIIFDADLSRAAEKVTDPGRHLTLQPEDIKLVTLPSNGCTVMVRTPNWMKQPYLKVSLQNHRGWAVSDIRNCKPEQWNREESALEDENEPQEEVDEE